jgi:hypothetical protein
MTACHRLVAATLTVSMLISGCGWHLSNYHTSKEVDHGRSAQRADSLAAQDSIAFQRAVAEERHSEALALLWKRTNAAPKPKGSAAGKVAGVAAMVAGLGLVIAANETIGNIDDTEDLGFDTDDSKTKWEIVRIAGFGAVIIGALSLALD